jgi:hypothetical protein
MRLTRHRFSTALAALATIALVFLASCGSPLGGAAAPGKRDAPASNGEAKVALDIGLAQEAARIVLPQSPSIDHYQLFGSRDGGARESLGSWTSLTGASVSVRVGSWDFLLEAYDASDTLVLEGSIAGKAISAATSLSFSLAALQSGSGSVKVTVLWPASDNLVASVQATLGSGSPQLLTPTAIPSSGLAVSYSNPSVAAGNYLLVLKLEDATGAAIATRSEWVLVRANLASTAEIELGPGDLNYLPAAPGEIGILAEGALTWSGRPITFAWSDTADNETGYRVEYSDDGEATWKTAATLAAGSFKLDMTLPRGVHRSLRAVAFNDLGESASIIDTENAAPLIDFSTSDSSIATVTVNLWDPTSLAFHGSATLTRRDYGFVGGAELNAIGTQLVQAYAYDSQGRIKAVAETTTGLSDPTVDKITLTAQGARLMGGSVQKTGQSLDETPVAISCGVLGVSGNYADGIACDGLNLYVSDQENYIQRQVISSKAIAVFAGAGSGTDEDHPGQSADMTFQDLSGLTTDGRYIYAVVKSDYRIYRFSYAASTKMLLEFNGSDLSGSPEWITTDGGYLYVADTCLHRVDLANLAIRHLDPADWTWKAGSSGGNYISQGLTTDGVKLFWTNLEYYNYDQTAFAYSMDLGGGNEARTLPMIKQGSNTAWWNDTGGLTTDGTSLYWFLGPACRTNSLNKIDIATGVVSTITILTSGTVNYRHIATDGRSLFLLIQ